MATFLTNSPIASNSIPVDLVVSGNNSYVLYRKKVGNVWVLSLGKVDNSSFGTVWEVSLGENLSSYDLGGYKLELAPDGNLLVTYNGGYHPGISK